MKELDRDRTWVQEILKHDDQQAWTLLVRKYHDPLFQFIQARIGECTEAEDLLQEIFTKVFRHLRSFNPRYAFSTWLFSIAEHHCIDYLRKQAKDDSKFEEPKAEESLLTVSHHENIDGAMSEPKFTNADQCLSRLPEKYRNVFSLRYIENLKYRQISEQTGMPIGTVKTYLYRAKAFLLTQAKIYKNA